ncbi:LysR family transcriptional regulator [Cupriavidus sp. TMH.W2]|uniref:LysR family transcriptional regulator n=1 Tax=Cupriavidus sp. TMH.W2 TaxID=3434465 RepID=UPI003D774DE0
MTTFKQLEAFVAIAEMGSFDGAAEQLDIAQSAVSRHIKEFEGGFGYPLFDRSGRTARLTLEGAEVLARSRDVLKKRDLLIEQFVRKDTLVRKLRLGVTELTAVTWLPRFVDAIRAQYPQVAIELEVEHSVPLHDRLRAGQLDLVVVPNAFDLTGLLRIRLAQVRNGWFCRPSLAIPTGKIRVAELGSYPLLMQGPQSGAGVLMRSWFAKNGLTPGNTLMSNSISALGGIAASGLGVVYMPEVVSRGLVEKGLLREVHATPGLPPIRYVALTRADSATPFHRAIATLAQRCCNFELPYEASASRAQYESHPDAHD